MRDRISWPEGKDFVFTVFDDTDRSSLKNVKEIYSFLTDCGFRTTKYIWPIRGNKKPLIPGSTCEESDYLSWVIDLKKTGFEIGYHNTTFHSSLRDETIMGIERFFELFGHYQKIQVDGKSYR